MALTSLGPWFYQCVSKDNVLTHSNHHLMITFVSVDVVVRVRVVEQTRNSSHVRHSFRLSALRLVLIEQHMTREQRRR